MSSSAATDAESVLTLEGMSITAARAVAKEADDGTFTMTLDDAVVTRQPDTKP